MKRSPLGRDPEKTRAWERRSRRPIPRHSELRRSRLKPKPKGHEKWTAQYGSEHRVRWGKAQDCRGCGRPARPRRPNLNCHQSTGGVGMKAGPETMCTLCPECDVEIAQKGRQTYERKRRVDLSLEAERQHAEYHRLFPA